MSIQNSHYTISLLHVYSLYTNHATTSEIIPVLIYNFQNKNSASTPRFRGQPISDLYPAATNTVCFGSDVGAYYSCNNYRSAAPSDDVVTACPTPASSSSSAVTYGIRHDDTNHHISHLLCIPTKFLSMKHCRASLPLSPWRRLWSRI